MVSSVQSELASGNYVAAIQDLLGNQGASLDFNGTSAAYRTSADPSSPAVILSLSADAQNKMSNGQIALDLLTAGNRQGASGNTHDAQSKSATASLPLDTPSSARQAAQAAPAASSAAASPSIADIVRAAHGALSDPTAYFHDTVKSEEGASEAFGVYLSDDQRAAFIAAFNNHTLSVQNAADVPGLDYTDETELTGSSEVANSTFNQQALEQYGQNSGDYVGMVEFPVIGALVFTYPKPPGATTSASPGT